MNIANRVLLVALTLVVVFQCRSLFVLRGEMRDLAEQVANLSAGVARQTRSAASVQRVVDLLGAGFAAAREERVTQPSDERVRGMVAEQVKRNHDEEREMAESALRRVDDEVRESVARQVRATDLEVEHLVELGDTLRTEEAALVEKGANGSTEDEANDARLRSWRRVDDQIRVLLGRDRYAQWEALRMNHPEYARSLYALRAAPTVAVAEGPSSAR